MERLVRTLFKLFRFRGNKLRIWGEMDGNRNGEDDTDQRNTKERK